MADRFSNDDDSYGISGSPEGDELFRETVCWSCWKKFREGEDQGVSIDESGEEQICNACWQMMPVTSRLVLGLLFRRLNQGGLGLAELIEDALRTWPFSQRPSRQ